MAVELRAVYADKLRLPAHCDAASAAHARSVDHDSIQRDIGRNSVFLCQQAHELHHDGRAYGKTFVHVLPDDDALHSFRHQALPAIASVVCHDDDFVGRTAHLVFKDDEFLGTAGQDTNDTVARSFQSLDNREHRCDAYAATGADYGAEVFDMGSLAQRTDHVGQFVADVHLTKTRRRQSYFLHDKRDGATLGVCLGNGERYTLAVLSDADNDEMACTAGFRNERSLDDKLKHFFRKPLFGYNSIHKVYCYVCPHGQRPGHSGRLTRIYRDKVTLYFPFCHHSRHISPLLVRAAREYGTADRNHGKACRKSCQCDRIAGMAIVPVRG